MVRKAKAIVLDAWAIMAYLEDEPPGEKVANAIADAHEQDTPLFMSIINVGEVWYIIAREASVGEADHSVTQLRQLGIEFVEADWSLTHLAASYKSKHKMPFADCFAAAMAKQKKAVLLTGDSDFKPLEREITIDWLRLPGR